MISFVLLGAALGILFAHAAVSPRRHFRRKFVEEYEFHETTGSGMDFIAMLVRDRSRWIRSISWIRKPFRNEVNLAVETAAFLLAAAGVLNSAVHFERYFKTTFQGEVALAFLSAVLTFLPAHRLMEARIDREIEKVFKGMEEAFSKGRIREYLARAKETWR